MINEKSEKNQNQKIKLTPITSEMEKSYLDYAMSVIVSRALPDVCDGLKPVQRRIIYAMYKQGLTSKGRFAKCAAVVGETMKKYHPHGDLSLYDALVRMAQNFSLRYPLIIGQGNFGSIDGDSPAAMRYTECKLSPLAEELLRDIEKETVDFTLNYSGEEKEPTVLPSCVPNLLLNGVSGIAVGMATNIPPHNLGEVVDALVYMIGHPEKNSQPQTSRQGRGSPKAANFKLQTSNFESPASTEELMQFIKGPDFPTRGKIYDLKEIAETYTTGKGQIIMRADAKIEEKEKGGFQIVILELPYQVNKALLLAKIANLSKNKKIAGLSDLRDESDRRGLRIVLELKKEARPQHILNLLYKHTELQKAFNANLVALVSGEPKVLTLKVILEEFITHRQRVVIRRSQFLLEKAKSRKHILLGLKIALDHLDEVIKTIKRSKDGEVAKERLMKKFNLSEVQATAILDMPLRRLSALERKKIEEELAGILETIKDLTELLSSPKKILKTIKSELLDLKKKYADERRTKVFKGKVGEFSQEELVASEDVIITFTKGGYIKRLKVETYKRQGRGGKGVKGTQLREEDFVKILKIANTHDAVLFFSNKGRVRSIKVWDIPEAGRTAKGTAIANLLDLEPEEKITSILTVPGSKFKEKAFIFMATEKGRVKKTPLLEFKDIRRTGIYALKLSGNDKLLGACTTTGKDEVILVAAGGKSIRFKELEVRAMGRLAQGVRGIKLGKEDKVVGMEVISKPQASSIKHLLVVTANGYGKKTKISKYRRQKRGGSGILTAKVTKKTGKIVASKILDKKIVDLLLISIEGQVIRLPVKDIPTLSRATQGVRLMRLNKGDSVAALTCFGED